VHVHRNIELLTFSASLMSHHVWRKGARWVHVIGAVGAVGAVAMGAMGAALKPCGCRDTGGVRNDEKKHFGCKRA